MNKWGIGGVYMGMEHKNSWMMRIVAGLATLLLLSNCVTTYDHQGRPVQRVDSGAVAVGALILVEAAAYAAAGHHYSHHGHRGHRRHH